MAKPFKGVVNVDVTESVPDWGPYTQPIALDGTPSVLKSQWPVGRGFERFPGTSTTPAALRSRVGRAEHPQPLVHDRGRGHDRHRGGRRRPVRPWLAVRRPRPVHQGRQAQVRLQLGRRVRADRRVDRADPDRPRRAVGLVREGGGRDADRGDAHPAHRRPTVGEARSRPSRASSRSPAKGSTSARTAPSRSPTTIRASRRGRSSAARSSGPSIDVSGEPFVDLARKRPDGVRAGLTMSRHEHRPRILERHAGARGDRRVRRARDDARAARTTCRPPSGSRCSTTTARSGARSRCRSSSASSCSGSPRWPRRTRRCASASRGRPPTSGTTPGWAR